MLKGLKRLRGERMPLPNHCIDCDKIATVTLNNVPYCAQCGIKAQQEPKDGEVKSISDIAEYFMYREL